jgi:CheY-specific phosphatase CheX
MKAIQVRLTALVLGRQAAALSDVLAALGVRVVEREDAAGFLAALDEIDDVSLLILSDDADRDEAAAALAGAKGAYPCVPAVWLGKHLGGAPLSDFRTSPDALLHEPFTAQAVRDAACELLQRFYTDTLAEVFLEVVESGVRDACRMDPSVPPWVRLGTTYRLRCPINAVIAVCGPGLSGHLMVGGSEETLTTIRRRLVGAASSGRYEAEDLAGEIANMAAGKLKYRLDELGVTCEIGTPLAVSSAGAVLRPMRGRAALLAEVHTDDGTLRCELNIDHCDDAQLDRLSQPLVRRRPSAAEEASVCFF